MADGLRILPVLHDRLESAVMVRALLDHLDPAALAVELPPSIRAAAIRAVARLPRISVVLSYESGEPLVWVTAPGDPLVEGLRWAGERRRRVHWIDPDFPYPVRHRDPFPDPYAAWSLGPGRYLELLADRPWPVIEEDRRREEGMAHRLARAVEETGSGGEVLALVGAAHVGALRELMRRPSPHPFSRRRRPEVELRHLDPESLSGLLPDPPLAHAVWEEVRSGSDREEDGEASLAAAVSRPASIIRHGLRLITGEGDESERRRRRAVVDGAARRAVRRLAGVPAPDRRTLAAVVWRIAASSYRAQTGDGLEAWQRRLFFDFTRRQARTAGQLAGSLYEWVVAARGVADDNLAWEVFDSATTYPWQEPQAEIASVRLDGDELDLGTHKLRFRRRFLRSKRRPVAVPVRRRPRPEDPGEWLRGFDSGGLCSYPPEDLVIEDYGRFLQKKAVSILAAETARVEPFTTSLLDGIDLRETLRNLEDDRVWVREQGRVPGEAGSVVVIFDADPEDERYPFRMTWLGEHDQESDMAFYSTVPAEQVVGPGIVRATYGGFMLSMPRGRLFDVWADPDYRWTRSKPEVLTLAAIDYSEQKIVVHVAARPPAARLKSYAASQAKRLLHVPIASLSGSTLKKIRVLHLLAGHDKRKIARDYIW